MRFRERLQLQKILCIAQASVMQVGVFQHVLPTAMYARSPRRCDNEGHVIKGLGSWPGFGWFEALRVYGPCPELQKNGIAYTR